PLIILAVLALLSGFINSPLSGYAFSDFVYYQQPHHPASSSFVMLTATLSWVIGVGVALAIYLFNLIPREAIRKALYPVWLTLRHRYWIDDFYNYVFVRGAIGLALFSAWFDLNVIDRIVNFV